MNIASRELELLERLALALEIGRGIARAREELRRFYGEVMQ